MSERNNGELSMERLTERDGNFFMPKRMVDDDRSYCEEYCHEPCDDYCPLYECFQKLANYEDAEEQGRLIELPVAKGSTVYYVPDYLYGQDSRIEELYVMGYRIFEDGATYLRVKQTRFSGTLVNIKRIGDDVFLTREEAETKRKELEEDNGQTD